MIQKILTSIALFIGLLWILFMKKGEEYINNYQNDNVNGTDFCF